MHAAWVLERRLHRPPFALRRSPWARLVRAAARWWGRVTIVRRRGFVLSRLGVWLADRSGDSTFRYSIEAPWDFGVDLARLLRAVPRPFIFLDVGANIGLFTLIALESARCRAVHAFEPDRSSLGYLRMNLENAGLDGCVVHPVAVSSRRGEAALWSRDGSSGNSLVVDPSEHPDAEPIRLVDAEYVSDVLEGSPFPVLCKIDVEGHEHHVLAALLPWGATSIAAFWVEFSAATDGDACRRTLSVAGYSEVLRSGGPEHYDALWVAPDDPLGLLETPAAFPPATAIASGDRTPRRR